MSKKLNEWADASKILHGFVILGFVLAFVVSMFSCQDFYIGKTEEELSREMFEVDSLMKRIQLQMDSVSVDLEKFYIDAYMSTMQIVLVLFMAATLAVVVIGVIAMAINGKLNKNHSNKLMRLRVLFQAIALLVFVIIIWLARN